MTSRPATYLGAAPAGAAAVVAHAHREDSWWVLEVEGVGATQARHLDDAPELVASLVNVMADDPADHVSPGDVAVVVGGLPAEVAEHVALARTWAAKAVEAQAVASERSRLAVRELTADLGLSQVDVAAVLGVSRQRVGQLLRG